MNFPTALTFVAGIGIAGAIALGVAPMASAAATNPVGGADPYVPAGTNPMVPYGSDAAQIYGDNPLERTAPTLRRCTDAARAIPRPPVGSWRSDPTRRLRTAPTRSFRSARIPSFRMERSRNNNPRRRHSAPLM